MADVLAVVADLVAEGNDLDGLVASLDADGLATPTPSPGWDIARQLAHLCWTDEVSVVAVTDADAFADLITEALADSDGYVDKGAARVAEESGPELIERWRTARQQLATALAEVPDGTRLPWFGPPMSATSMATARLMETWAHGQDVADALGVTRVPTARLRNIAHLGVRTRNFAYNTQGLDAPTQEVRVELTAPDGDTWVWGPEDATQRVTGPALDFCLLVTQRRHRADLALVAEGDEANQWLDIAQAFAGPSGEGRTPTREASQ